MDKPLPDKEKGTATPEKDAPYPSDTGFARAGGVGAYSAHSADLSGEAWAKGHKPWNASPQGRLAIRLFSRGVMGAAFFAVGSSLSKKWLENGANRYRNDSGWNEVDNPLKFVAKLVDTVVGKPIEVVVGSVAGEGMGRRATTFRPTIMHVEGQQGHSLGHEAVSITFDFFSASVGDAFGRDIAGWFDPNIKKKWIKDGKISIPEAINSALKSTARYVAYHGGEDLAVAIPYAYYMKGQRAVLNRFSPGFMYDFDGGLHGGSFKIDETGKIIGNYNLEGMIDLQGRFTAYNIGTLMYREGYNYIADRLEGKKASLYGAPDKIEKGGLAHNIANGTKWGLRSIVKGTIFMTPAIPFFSVFRSSQRKHHGLFIHKDDGVLSYSQRASDRETWVLDASFGKDKATYLDQYGFVKHNYEGNSGRMRTTFKNGFDDHHIPVNPNGAHGYAVKGNMMPENNSFRAYNQGLGALEKVTDAVGRGQEHVRRELRDHVTKPLDEHSGALGARVKSLLGLDEQKGFKHLGRTYVNAAMSYTPYMYAKGETARLWDDGKMDMSIERMIDGATGLKWGEFKAGAGEVWRSLLRKPLSDPEREREAQHRVEMDSSPPMDIGPGERSYRMKEGGTGWRTRLVQGVSPAAADTAKKKEALTPRAANYVDQEEMRKALNDLTPPTSSIH